MNIEEGIAKVKEMAKKDLPLIVEESIKLINSQPELGLEEKRRAIENLKRQLANV